MGCKPRLHCLDSRTCCQRVDLKKTRWRPECSLSTQITQQGFDAERRDLLMHFIYFSHGSDCFTWYVCAALNFLYPLNRSDELIHHFCFSADSLWVCSNRFCNRGCLKGFTWNVRRTVTWNSNLPLKPVRPRCYYALLRGANHHAEGGQEPLQKQSKCGWPAKRLIKLLANLWLPGLMKVWSKKGAMNGQPACSQCVAIVPKQARICPRCQQSKHLPHPWREIITWWGLRVGQLNVERLKILLLAKHPFTLKVKYS